MAHALPREPVWVSGDRAQLEQLVLNLVVNARDAMPSGGTLRLGLRVDGDAAVLDVADDGVGMDADTRERIFEAFFSTKSEGTGLGLATVKDLVERHDGRVDVWSEPGRGTTFTIRLPMVPAPAAALRAISSVSGGSGRLRVLLVEDNDLVRASIQRLIGRLGHDVVAVPDGEIALETIQADPSFRALVSDVAMPGLSGHGLVEALDRLGIRPPTVLISGYDERLPPTLSPGSPGLRWLAKPFTATDLQKALEAVGAVP